MPIPPFEPNGYLPAGDHDATLSEVEERFGWTYRRRQLFKTMEWVTTRLRERGVSEIYIAGSFVTDKERPRDVDLVYFPPAGADIESWGIFAFSRHKELKRQHHIDLWPHPSNQSVRGNPTKFETIKEKFSTDRDDVPRGLIFVTEEEP